MSEQQYDVVVIGGGAAGLSGALALARARRRVLVIDSGQPRNAPAGHVHNYLGREGTPPRELLAIGRAEVAGYGGEFVDGTVERVVPLPAAEGQVGGFELMVDGDRRFRARRLLVTTGVHDELPDVPGVRERWGLDVLHCPYCHGWEVRDQRVGVLATGPMSVLMANLWRQWTPHVVLLMHRQPAPAAEDTEWLSARGIPVVAGEVAALEVAGDALTGARLASGEVVPLDALVAPGQVVPRAGFLAGLGLTPDEVGMNGHVVGGQLPADPAGATTVPGVWVAGNVADVRGQVITSAAAGLTAAGAINMDLVAEDTRIAVEAHRHELRTLFEEEAWEARYRSAGAIWSGNPNPQLIAEATGLPPARALDVGSGEGADAIWLAGRGWRVTAVDISTTALERGAAHAAAAGPEVAARIDWVHADLREKPAGEGLYDLVTAQFMHLPEVERQRLFAGLAASVAPGGVLLIVGHHPSDLHGLAHRMHFPELMYTAEQVATALDPAGWEVLAADARPRTVSIEGTPATVHDAVMVARRL